MNQTGRPQKMRSGRDVHNLAFPPLFHKREDRFAAKEHAFEVHGHDLVPLLLRDLKKRLWFNIRDAGIVDQNVYAAQFLSASTWAILSTSSHLDTSH